MRSKEARISRAPLGGGVNDPVNDAVASRACSSDSAGRSDAGWQAASRAQVSADSI